MEESDVTKQIKTVISDFKKDNRFILSDIKQAFMNTWNFEMPEIFNDILLTPTEMRISEDILILFDKENDGVFGIERNNEARINIFGISTVIDRENKSIFDVSSTNIDPLVFLNSEDESLKSLANEAISRIVQNIKEAIDNLEKKGIAVNSDIMLGSEEIKTAKNLIFKSLSNTFPIQSNEINASQIGWSTSGCMTTGSRAYLVSG